MVYTKDAQKLKIDKHKSNFGKIDETGSPMSIDSSLAANYDPEIVKYAEQLKGHFYRMRIRLYSHEMRFSSFLIVP